MKFAQFLQIAILFSTTCFISTAKVISDNGGQQITFTHISTNEGLSQGTILSSCQDKTGQMWFATHDGLNRYDGNSFTVYRNSPEDSTSLPDNMIRKVYLDMKGRLWIGTAGSLSLYDSKKDRFINFPTNGMAVTGIAETGEQSIILIAAGGRIRFFDADRHKWEDIRSGQLENINATIMYRHGKMIWIGTTHDGILCYHTDSKEFKKVSSFKSRHKIQCMTMSDDNTLWIATEGDGLYRLNIKTGESTNYRHTASVSDVIASNYVRTLSVDIYGRLWIGTFNGLSILEDGKFTNLYSDPLIQGSLSQASVRCICRDDQGGMWLGTWFGGINYWHPLRNRFHTMQKRDKGTSLNDNVISCIKEDKDKSLWIGTNSGGVNHYDPNTGRFRYYTMTGSTASENLESNDIKAIHIDKERGLVFVGIHAGGLNTINKRTGEIRHCTSEDRERPYDVYSIMPADRNSLWIGTLDGLKTYDIRTGVFKDTEDANGYVIRRLSIRTMFRDSKDRLWIGGEDGLLCLQIRSGVLTETDPNINNDNPLEDTFVQCIYESSSGLIWIATRQGLYYYNSENKCFRYTTSDGLPSSIIYGIEEDTFGRLWLSTDNGLSCFNPYSNIFRNFSIADGLQSNKFNTNSHCRRSNGEMLFGGICGITVFNPEDMSDNPFTPQPILTSLQVFSKPVRPEDVTGILQESITSSDKITLQHNQNSFTLGFTVTNYLSGQHNSYSYTLEGYDKEWYETKGNSITYSNLPHGKYRFMLKAANNDGKWNEDPIGLDIIIKPVWYKTGLALCIYIVLILAVIWVAYRFVIYRKEKENRIELDKQEKAHQEEIHQMKTRFFINISHEMRTPLTLIINPLSEMIAKCSDSGMRKQLKYLERNAKRLLHLVNQLMDYRRAELGVFKLKIRPENVHKIIKENWAFYDKLAQNKKLKYTLDSGLEGATVNIDGQYLELILNNLLSNAFKYTDSGEIKVRAYKTSDSLMIQVSDTGTGIPADQQDRIFERFYRVDSENIGSGIGLSLVQKLVELHHGKITLESETGKGSTFTVTLPLIPEAYSPEEMESSDTMTHTSNAQQMYIIDTENIEEDTAGSDNAKRGRILIADDDEDVRNYLKNGLKDMFDIDLAKNGEEALQILKVNEPDIVISDMIMPVMDGRKLCSNIKQNLATSHIPVIILSANTDSKTQLDILKAGADDFMTKPFSLAVLIAKIQNIRKTHHRIEEKVTRSMEIEPAKISFNAMEEQFLNKAIAVVEKNIDNTEFSTEEFAAAMNMSRSNLHIRLKSLTGESALDFIRKIRFKEACRLLKDGRYSISEISDRVGFNTPSYFATCFKKYMGCLPTEYVKNQKP